MSDIAPNQSASIYAAAGHQMVDPLGALRRWWDTQSVTRDQRTLFTLVAILVAAIAASTATFGVIGLLVSYLALVPVTLVVLVIITIGG